MRSISFTEYFSVSHAYSPSAPSAEPRSPKYIPPVSSRTIIISTPSFTSSYLSGEALASDFHSFAGRMLEYSPISCRMRSSPFSGRLSTGMSSHLYPPTAPSSTLSAARQPSAVARGSGSPHSSMAQPPIG